MSDWSQTIEHVAAWMFREEHGWRQDASWARLPAVERERYLKRATTIGYMFNFPNASNALADLDRLCPCDPNPESANPGPERECLLHGQMPWAVIRMAEAERIAEIAARYVRAPVESGLAGNAGEVYDELVAAVHDWPPEIPPDPEPPAPAGSPITEEITP